MAKSGSTTAREQRGQRHNGSEGASVDLMPNPLIDALVKDAHHPPDVVQVEGYVGRSPDDASVRLYPSLTRLTEWIDIPAEAVLHAVPNAASDAQSTATLWIDAEADVMTCRVTQARAWEMTGTDGFDFDFVTPTLFQPAPRPIGNWTIQEFTDWMGPMGAGAFPGAPPRPTSLTLEGMLRDLNRRKDLDMNPALGGTGASAAWLWERVQAVMNELHARGYTPVPGQPHLIQRPLTDTLGPGGGGRVPIR